MIKLSGTLALFIFCWVPLTHAASNEGQNRGGSAAAELSLQTRHYAEKSRAKRILTNQSHSNETYYSQMIETLLALPADDRSEVIRQISALPAGLATLLPSSRRSSKHDERIQKWIATQDLLTEITTTIAKNTVFMNFLRERALLSGQGTVEARKLLNTLNSCSRLLGAARTE